MSGRGYRLCEPVALFAESKGRIDEDETPDAFGMKRREDG